VSLTVTLVACTLTRISRSSTRRAAGRRGCDRPGGRAAVRARPSEGDGLGHLLTRVIERGIARPRLSISPRPVRR